jgi:hypothetical protein
MAIQENRHHHNPEMSHHSADHFLLLSSVLFKNEEASVIPFLCPLSSEIRSEPAGQVLEGVEGVEDNALSG